jgi:glyoxylase-like metal-dependent hydrolase (beta-lactamase superfamily II)
MSHSGGEFTMPRHHAYPEDASPVRIDDGLHLLDLGFQGTSGAIGSWLLAGGGEVALLEVGPGSTRENLQRMVGQAGYAMDDVSRLIVTHIHLDHAGAAGLLMQDYPHLRLTLHEAAAPFLVSVDRLWNSAARIYGDQMTPLWGEAIDVSEDRIDPVRDGDVIQVAGTTLRALSTPGHAGTHLAYFDEQRRVLFTGDAAGARMSGTSLVVPTLAPPELDFELWGRTVAVMRGLEPERLALTHFGMFDDAERHLDAIIPSIESAMELAGRVLRSPEDEPGLTEALDAAMREAYEAEGGDVDAKYASMQLAMPGYLAAKGLVRVFRKSGRFDE